MALLLTTTTVPRFDLLYPLLLYYTNLIPNLIVDDVDDAG